MAGRPIRALRNSMRDADGLEPRERRWIDRVLIHSDMQRAHREAFGENYRSKTYMKDERVTNVLKREVEARHKRYELTADDVLRELSYIIHGRTRDLYNEDGSLKSPAELDDATDASIAGVDIEDIRVTTDEDSEITTTSRVRKYKRYSKTEAISLAMKLRLLADVVAPTRAELTGKDGAPLTAPPIINVSFGDGQ